jgi:hypothetical protein
MEIVLVCYVFYAFAILVWCSSAEVAIDDLHISSLVLEQWSGREDVILFELYPEPGPSRRPVLASWGEENKCPPEVECSSFLPVTPAGLLALLDWIPPGSHLVLCNRGLTTSSLRALRAALDERRIPRVHWLEHPRVVGTRRPPPGVNAAHN